jgi:hypothetical protein
MPQTCSKCSRVNPAEASYCYYDGSILDGHGRNGGPVNAGTQPFPSQFVFPNGLACRNFDQLALACQQNWSEAVNLLKQGFLSSFLGGVGRADLALAAQEASKFPDQDRGLDQLLAKLPSQVVEAPSLSVEPRELNLGQLTTSFEHKFELHLANQGMRLLYGSIVSDCKWLTLGDAPGNPQKLFQFGNDLAVTVHVRGQFLRASNKPLEGRLVIDSNGGTFTVVVRAEVPVRPFREGVLAGAISPRQIAEKAKAAPKEAALLFEKGAVAAWYKENGWTYPVQGPSASGLGAVQQFFEALGLTTPPKVDINEQLIRWKGNVGDQLKHVLEVRTREKRPVYAHATVDQPWLEIGRIQLNGRTATIPVLTTVPPRPGEVLQGRVTVTANGNQRFLVPVTLTIGGSSYYPPMVEIPQLLEPQFEPPPLIPVPVTPVVSPSPPLVPPPLPPGMPVLPASSPIAATPAFPAFPAPLPAARTPARAEMPSPARAKVRREKTPLWGHLLPAGLLVLVLLGVVIKDMFSPEKKDGGSGLDVEVAWPPRIKMTFDPKTQRFGLATLSKDKENQLFEDKSLTFHESGLSNNTVLKFDDEEIFYGDGGGLNNTGTSLGKWNMPGIMNKTKDGKKSVWEHKKVTVTQTVSIIPGEEDETTGKSSLDTCLIVYEMTNHGEEPRTVGVRFMLDTLIGSNDGVPFLLPGQKQFENKHKDFSDPASIPAFISAYENEDFDKPGTIAQVGLKVGQGLEPPSRVLLCAWPNKNLGDPRAKGENTLWDVPIFEMKAMAAKGGQPDSAVIIYWEPKELKKGQTRKVGFTYGLGSLTGTSRMRFQVGGSLTVGSVFTLTALVKEPEEGQKLTLNLPEGFELVDAETKTQAVNPNTTPSPVTWQIRATVSGRHELTVHSSNPNFTQKKKIRINTKSTAAGIFGS